MEKLIFSQPLGSNPLPPTHTTLVLVHSILNPYIMSAQKKYNHSFIYSFIRSFVRSVHIYIVRQKPKRSLYLFSMSDIQVS